MELYISLLSIFVLVTLGYMEKKQNEKNLVEIPIRVNVNGIRGKSTITRMITSVMTEAGFNTMGKTTGTAPRIINNQEKEEIEILRKPKGVTISEQIDVIDYAAKSGVSSLVCECMAVNPDYQKIYQEQMIQANIGVIINVLEDHMDLMGPTLDEVALAFTSTIPYNGKLILQDNEYTEYFSEIAQERNTQVFIADEKEIPEGFLNEFNFMVFPNNVAITLAFAKAMRIEKEVALQGMLKMNPDPGALTFRELSLGEHKFRFINGFAINDPSSVLEAWDKLEESELLHYGKNKLPLVVFNGRSDRIDRTIQFSKDCSPFIKQEHDLLLIGQDLGHYWDEFEIGNLESVVNAFNFENKEISDVYEELLEIFSGRTVLAIGNIHGHGYELLNLLDEEYSEDK